MENMHDWFYTNCYTYYFGRFLYTMAKLIKWAIIIALIVISGATILRIGSWTINNLRNIALTTCFVVSMLASIFAIVMHNNKKRTDVAITVGIVAFITGYIITQVF